MRWIPPDLADRDGCEFHWMAWMEWRQWHTEIPLTSSISLKKWHPTGTTCFFSSAGKERCGGEMVCSSVRLNVHAILVPLERVATLWHWCRCTDAGQVVDKHGTNPPDNCEEKPLQAVMLDLVFLIGVLSSGDSVFQCKRAHGSINFQADKTGKIWLFDIRRALLKGAYKETKNNKKKRDGCHYMRDGEMYSLSRETCVDFVEQLLRSVEGLTGSTIGRNMWPRTRYGLVYWGTGVKQISFSARCGLGMGTQSHTRSLVYYRCLS